MSLYYKYFTGMGVDVSDHHVRIAHVGPFGAIKRLMEIELPEGLVVDEKILKADELKKIVNTRLEKEGFSPDQIRTTLLVPESRVFTSSFLFPTTKSKEQISLESIDKAQQEIPIPFEQAVKAVARGGKSDHQVRSTVYATEKTVFDGLTQSFDPLYFHTRAMEANSKALLRLFQRHGNKTLQIKDKKTLIGIVDIGHSWATISLYLPDGSNLFSRTLSYRRDQGDSHASVQLPQSAVDFIHRTIEEVVVYFDQNQRKIGLFLFAGVEAEDDRFKTQKEFHQLGDVVKLNGQKKRVIHTFGAVIGAAIRSVHPHQYSHQHNFIYSR